MNKMKKALALVLVFTLLFVAVGCGKKDGGSKATLSAAEVRDKMVEASENISVVKSVTDCTISINMAMGSGDMSFDMKMDMDMGMEYIVSNDPVAGYFCTTMSMEAMGMNEEETTTVYLVEENGEYVTYTHSSSTDEWERSVADEEYQDKLSQGTDYSYLSDLDEDELKLEKKTEEIDGRETYVLSFTISGDNLEKMGMDMGEMMDMGMDLSALSFPMTLYIDTETFLPVRSIAQIEGMSEMFKELMKASMGDSVEEMEIDISFKDFVTNMTYDGVEVPSIPSEAMGH